MMSGFASSGLKELDRKRTMVSEVFGIAKMVVFVRSFKQRNDDRVGRREEDKGAQERKQKGVNPAQSGDGLFRFRAE